MKKHIDLERSVQITNGLGETSSDGAALAFDTKYGIMFCAYMPGPQGRYGESRGRISLSYFPASQPTNIKFVDIAWGHDEYVPNIISLGDGVVRVIYAIGSRDDGQLICYKDFNFLTEELSDEVTVNVKRDDGTVAPLTTDEQFAYLEARGYTRHEYRKTEQITTSGHGIFKGDDGFLYGAITSFLSEVILYRSRDNFESVEFFAVCPEVAQYEFDWRYLNGKIYAIYRTDKDENAIRYITSEDNGITWSRPIEYKESIQCRPRMIVHNGHILVSYNYYNTYTGCRPDIQQGRTSIRLRLGEAANPHENPVVADIHSKYGIVNVCLIDIMGDAYMAFSTSVCALEYHNGNSKVRGKDAIRYIKLGDLLRGE